LKYAIQSSAIQSSAIQSSAIQSSAIQSSAMQSSVMIKKCHDKNSVMIKEVSTLFASLLFFVSLLSRLSFLIKAALLNVAVYPSKL